MSLLFPHKLSKLIIDVAKNWAGKKIENLGAPDSGDDAKRHDSSVAGLAGVLTEDQHVIDAEALAAAWANIDEKSFVNLLVNGDFEIGDPPTGWAIYEATVTRETTPTPKVGSYIVKILKLSVHPYIYQTIADYARYKGRKMTFGAWTYCPSGVTGDAEIAVNDGIGSDTTNMIKDDAWHWLTVTRTIDAGATKVEVRIANWTAGAGEFIYADGAILVEGEVCPAFSEKPAGEYHATRHQDGGADEINVAALSGLLADDQHVLDAEVLLVAAALVHATRHQNGGADEISVAGLSGLLADDQHVLDAEVLLVAAALVHAARHKDGGADELDVSELAGALGSAGEIPETNGAAVSWVEPDGRYSPKAHNQAASTITSGRFPVDRLPAMTDEKYWVGTGANVEERDVPSAKSIATGSYLGNGLFDRQITVGFKCSMVVITYDSLQWVLIPSATVIHEPASPYHSDQVTYVYLHATDGFYVDDDDVALRDGANAGGVTYYYYAISE